MKHYILLILVTFLGLTITSCAAHHQTAEILPYCYEHQNLYVSLDQCNKEMNFTAKEPSAGMKILKALSRGLQGMGQGLQQSSQQQRDSQLRCRPDGLGNFNCQK